MASLEEDQPAASAEAAEAPAETADAPAETADTPAETADAPAETADTPAETTDAPAETARAPAETTEAPAETVGAPAETTEAPAEDDAAAKKRAAKKAKAKRQKEKKKKAAEEGRGGGGGGGGGEGKEGNSTSSSPRPITGYGSSCLYTCCVCGAESSFQCTGCRVARYCSQACQHQDWKAHKRECKKDILAVTKKGKALMVTISLDCADILGSDYGTAATGLPSAITGVFMFKGGANAIARVFLTLSGGNDVATLGVATQTYLKKVVDAGPLLDNGMPILTGLFKYPRDDGSAAQSGPGANFMPVGLQYAANVWSADATKVLRNAPRGTPIFELVRILQHSKILEHTQMRRSRRAVCHLAELGRQEHMYAAGFERGMEKSYDYPAEVIPVGSRITVLHFSNGIFFRAVDFTACRGGLFAERIVAMPDEAAGRAELAVVDCRAKRAALGAVGGRGEMQRFCVLP